MDDIAHVNSDTDLETLFVRRRSMALGEGFLDRDRAARRFQCAGELNPKAIACAVHLDTIELSEERTQAPPLFFQQFDGQRFIGCASAL